MGAIRIFQNPLPLLCPHFTQLNSCSSVKTPLKSHLLQEAIAYLSSCESPSESSY